MVYVICFMWIAAVCSVWNIIKGKIKKYAVIWSLVIISVPVVFSALRGEVGTDTFKFFYPYYANIIVNSSPYYGVEIGFLFFWKAVNLIFHSFPWELFFTALIIWLLFFVRIMKDEDANKNLLMTSIGMMSLYFGASLNIMRQMTATAIFFFAISFIIERKMIRYFIAIAVAALFHTSSIFLFPLYFFYSKNKKKQGVKNTVINILIILLPLLFPFILDTIFGLDIFRKYATGYSLSSGSMYGVFSRVIIRLPLYVLEAVTLKNMLKRNLKSGLYFKLILLEFVSILCSSSMLWAFRFMYYFSSGHVLYCSCVLNEIKDKKTKIFYSVLLIAYFIAYFYVVHFIWKHEQIVPFTFNPNITLF